MATTNNGSGNIDRSPTWRAFSLSTNYFRDLSGGSIIVHAYPDEFAVFKSYNNKSWSITDSHNSTVVGIDSVNDVDGINVSANVYRNGVEPAKTTNAVIHSEGDWSKDVCVYFYNNGQEDAMEYCKTVLNDHDEFWRKINLNTNIGVIYYKYQYVWVNKTFSPVVSEKKLFRISGYNSNTLKISSLELLMTDVGSTLEVVNGDESLLISDKFWNANHLPAKRALEEFNVEKASSGTTDYKAEYLEDVFENALTNEYSQKDDFVFSCFDDVNPILASATESADKPKKCYVNVNLTYSKQYPKIKIVDVSPTWENYQVEAKVGSPSEENGKKYIPVKIYYLKDFIQNEEDVSYKPDTDYDNNVYNYYSRDSLITIKATCTSKDGKQSKETYIYITNSTKQADINDWTTTLELQYNVDTTSSKYEAKQELKIKQDHTNELVDLPTIDPFMGSIIGYKNSKADKSFSFKNNYKVPTSSSTNIKYTLYPYSWRKVALSGAGFLREDLKVSSLPLYFEDRLFYINEDSNSFLEYGLKGAFSTTWTSFVSQHSNDSSNNNAYGAVCTGNATRRDDFKRVIFAYDNKNCKTSIKVEDYRRNLFEISFSLESDAAHLFYPFYYAFISEVESGVLKVPVYATKNMKYLVKDDSFDTQNLFESSIGDISILEINLQLQTASLRNLYTSEVENVEKTDTDGVKYIEKVCTVRYPKTTYTFKTNTKDLLLTVDSVSSSNRTININNIKKYTQFLDDAYLYEIDKDINDEELWSIPYTSKTFTLNTQTGDITITEDNSERTVVIPKTHPKNEKDFKNSPYVQLYPLGTETLDTSVVFCGNNGSVGSVYKYDFKTKVISNCPSSTSTTSYITNPCYHIFTYEEYDGVYSDGVEVANTKNVIVSKSSDSKFKLYEISSDGKWSEFKDITIPGSGNINTVKHIHLGGVYSDETTSSDAKTDCALIVSRKNSSYVGTDDIYIIFLTSSGVSHKITNPYTEPNEQFAGILKDAKMFNGILYARSVFGETSTSTSLSNTSHVFGGLHPTY